ncbi:hypothetical protein AWB73_01123 [Caballeronia turbans]|nr:hypothetical protein AWB73_01123 [Caballeronia turbans]
MMAAIKERHLTDEAQAERDEFEGLYRNYSCSCFISAPCSTCTHPSNPLNQENDDEC